MQISAEETLATATSQSNMNEAVYFPIFSQFVLASVCSWQPDSALSQQIGY